MWLLFSQSYVHIWTKVSTLDLNYWTDTLLLLGTGEEMDVEYISAL